MDGLTGVGLAGAFGDGAERETKNGSPPVISIRSFLMQLQYNSSQLFLLFTLPVRHLLHLLTLNVAVYSTATSLPINILVLPAQTALFVVAVPEWCHPPPLPNLSSALVCVNFSQKIAVQPSTFLPSILEALGRPR